MSSQPDTGVWGRRLRQLVAVARLELRRCLRGRALVTLALLNLAPAVLLLLGHLLGNTRVVVDASPANLSRIYAVTFALYTLRLAVFFTAAALSVQLFRGEMLAKTLHYYLLAPVRREIVVGGKLLAGALASGAICGFGTLSAYLAVFAGVDGGLRRFLLHGAGGPHLLAYLGVTVLACFGYTAVFALLGLLWRNPTVSFLALLGWEGFLFLLPPFLKAVSVLFYLESLLPYRLGGGPLAILADPPPPLVSVGGLLLFVAAVVALAGWRARRLEIAYTTD